MKRGVLKESKNSTNESLKKEAIKIIETLKIGRIQRAEAILVLLGLKPATELTIYQWNEAPEIVKDKIKKTGLLIKAGRLNEDARIKATFSISLDEKLADELINLEPGSHEEYGKLMGFPETAIKAFLGEAEALEMKDYPDSSIFTFRLSKKRGKKRA